MKPLGRAEIATFYDTLARLRELPIDDPVRLHAERAVSALTKEGRAKRRRQARERRRSEDDAVVRATATGATDRRADVPVVADGLPGVLHKPRRCYVCKAHYQRVDSFYHLLCPACAAENRSWRTRRTDLTGRRALVTGGRVKIGFQLALKLLRDGAEVLVTTRFPHDAGRRFAAEPDSPEWMPRITVIGIDLRDPRQVLGLCERLEGSVTSLDILVNNAAQTIARPPEAYRRLITGEDEPGPLPVLTAPGYRPRLLHHSTPIITAHRASIAPADIPPPGEHDAAGLSVDTAPSNSWSTPLGRLDPVEMLETQLVNAYAPALLCDRLLPLLLASPRERRYIVNVSAVEGRFTVRNKSADHPHTNMAKAALNMLTRTSGPGLADRGVYMNAVDTGWITDENPFGKRARLAANGFRTPLDIVDGAARVYHPILRGEAGSPPAGLFLKDYREAQW